MREQTRGKRDAPKPLGPGSAGPGDEPHVLVVDDDDRALRLTQAALEVLMLSYEVTRTSKEAVRTVHRAKGSAVSVLLYEPVLRSEPPFRLLEALRAEGSQLPIVILSGALEGPNLAQAFAVGADEWLSKPVMPSVLLSRLQHAMDCRRAISSGRAPLRFLDLEVDLAGLRVRASNAPIDLSLTELRVLAALIQAAGQAVARVQLARQVWRVADSEHANAIDHTLRRLRSHLVRCSRVGIVTVPGVGWRLVALPGREELINRPNSANPGLFSKARSADFGG